MSRVSQPRQIHKRRVIQQRCRPSPGQWMEQLEGRLLRTVSGYSPITEVGNNAANPNLGTAGTDLLRQSPAAYKPVSAGGDGLNTPSLTYGAPTFVAGPRLVSNIVANQAAVLFGDPSTDINTVDGNGLSDFGYTFGQFMDHDMDLTPTQSDPAPAVNPNKDGVDGFPIPADPNQPADPIGSLDFTRSVFDPTTGITTPRQQINAVTSYLDLSQIYGSTQVVSDALRTFSGGLLKTSPGNLLPYDSTAYFTPDQITALNMANDSGAVATSQLFAAGDVRANENVELTALETLFVRNHNMIAAELQQQNPTWNDQQLFQEARKLNIAQYQNIIYTQYLPDLLGPTAMPAYTGYNPSVDPSIANEFSTVAFRFGHSMLNDTVNRDNNNGSAIADPTGTLQLAQDFFDPNLINPNGVIDPLTGHVSTDIGALLKGDADSASQAVDVMSVSDIRDLLFGNGPAGSPPGDDLIARDIWRADDNGIGTYNQLLTAYGLPPITNDATNGFDQITSNPQVQSLLEQAYTGPTRATFLQNGKDAGDINPFIAGLAEDHVPGSDMGPLFTTILVNQFTRLETGDQFFYLNESFTPAEQAILNQGKTLGQIITSGSGVTNLQADVFKFPSTGILLVNANGKNALTVSGGSSVTVSDGGTVIVNSSNSSAATVSGGSNVTAGEIEVDGGSSATGGSSFSQAVVHTGPTTDPLTLPLPPIPTNTFSATHIQGGATTTLSPGEYIGGININGGSHVTLSPGIYYLQGGGFTVSGGASVTGAGVLIVNAAGTNPGSIAISGGANVNLSAPTTLAGSLSAYNGIVMFQDPTDTNSINISGGVHVSLSGTLFAASAVLAISGGSIFSDTGTVGVAALILSELSVTGGSAVTVTF